MHFKLLLFFFPVKLAILKCNLRLGDIIRSSVLTFFRLRKRSWVLSSCPPFTSWWFPYAVCAGSLPLRQPKESFLSDEGSSCVSSFSFSLQIFSFHFSIGPAPTCKGFVNAWAKKNDELAAEISSHYSTCYFYGFVPVILTGLVTTYGVWLKMTSCSICKKQGRGGTWVILALQARPFPSCHFMA